MYNGFLHVSCLLKHIQLMHNLIVYLGHNVSAYEYCSRNFKLSALLPWDCGLAKLPVVKKFWRILSWVLVIDTLPKNDVSGPSTAD